MSEDFIYQDPFIDEEEEVRAPQKTISQDEGFERMKKELERTRLEKADLERQAHINAQRASTAEQTVYQREKAQLEAEKERVANEVKVNQIALKMAKESQEYDKEIEITQAMIETQSRLSQIDAALKEGPRTSQVSTQVEPQSVSYDSILNNPSTSQMERDFLAQRGELRDPQNFNVLISVIKNVGDGREYVYGTPGWYKEVDRRLEMNGVYESRVPDSVIEKTNREGKQMAQDQDDYRDRHGSPSDRGPTSVPRGDSGSGPRSRPGVVTLTKEQRAVADSVGDWGDGKYAKGVAMIDFLKRKGQYKDPKDNDGKLEICLGGLREFAKMQNRGR